MQPVHEVCVLEPVQAFMLEFVVSCYSCSRGPLLARALPALAVSGSKCSSPTLAVSGSKYLSLLVNGLVSCETVVMNIASGRCPHI